MEFFTSEFLMALFMVVMVDLFMSADNAIIVGSAIKNLPATQKKKAIIIGIGAATFFRIVFSLIVVQLLSIVGIRLGGGILLLYVCYKMYQEIHTESEEKASPESKNLWHAIKLIVIADIAMSLDNVLAVGGASHGNNVILIIGLVLSVAFMAFASVFIAKLLNKYHWLNWVGLFLILYIALEMIITGGKQVIELPEVFSLVQSVFK